MKQILDLLNSNLGQQIVNGVAQQSNQPKEKTGQLLGMAMPMLMQAMKRNASTPEGAQGILSAIDSKHDGSILENIGGLFSPATSNAVENDGEKILGHILGKKQQPIEMALSKQSGIDLGSVAKILKMAAPILMGMLGKQKRQSNVSDPDEIEQLIGGLLSGQSSQKEQSFLESILDADNDGNIIDDVANMFLGGDNKSSSGGILGDLLGK